MRRAPVTTLHALVPQHAQQRLARLGLLAAQRRVAAQHHRDLDAEAVERLGELARRSARRRRRSSDFGRSVRRSEVVAREIRRALEALDRRDPRARADGEHRGDAAQHASRRPRRRRRARRRGSARAAHPQHVVPLQQVLVEAAAVVDHLVDARHHRRAVDLDRRAHAELVAPPCAVCDLGRPDQGLRRDAPDVDSGAAERLGLDHRDACAEPAGAHRAGDAAHPAADHDELGRVASRGRHAVRRARGRRARSSRRPARGGRARHRAAARPRGRPGTARPS